MEAQRLLRIIFHHKLLILLLSLSAVIHVVLITYVIDEKYKASALILVRPREELRFSGQETRKNILDFPLGINAPHEAPTKTFTELIKSRPVAERVVRNLGLDKKTRVPEQGYLKEMWLQLKDDAKEYVKKAWDILKYGRIMQGDPFEKAVQEVQKRMSVHPTAKSYIFEISCLWKTPQLARDIVNETAQVFVELLVTLSEGEAKGTREFIEQRLQDTQRELAEARETLRRFKEQNKSILFNEEVTEKIKMISDLEASLEKTEAKLSGQLQELTPSHPKVLRLQAEKDSLVASIAQLKNGLQNLPDKESRLATLKLQVKVAEETFEFVKKEYEEARIREAKRASEIGVVSPAVLSTTPVKPIKIYYAGVAFFIALMTGIVSAFILESMNAPLLENIEEVERALDLPVLATIPQIQI